MMVKKGLLSICLIMLVVFFVSACGTSDRPSDNEQSESTESVGSVAGGWELYDNEASALPEEVQTAFDKSVETLIGDELKPVAYVASQAVAGTNYMILCQATTTTETPSTSYQMVIVNADLEGNAEVTEINEFDLTAYTEGDNSELSAEQIAGGWEVAEDQSSSVIPQEAKDAFDKAAKNLDGNELQPLALLGTQVVAGTNYAFLCHSTLQTEETIRGIQVVTIYEDLDGNAEIINIATVNPADYNE